MGDYCFTTRPSACPSACPSHFLVQVVSQKVMDGFTSCQSHSDLILWPIIFMMHVFSFCRFCLDNLSDKKIAYGL